MPNMVLVGKVKSIIGFGAFVDIGVGHDGILYISELREGFVSSVKDVVRVGQVVRVRVLHIVQRKGWQIRLRPKGVSQEGLGG